MLDASDVRSRIYLASPPEAREEDARSPSSPERSSSSSHEQSGSSATDADAAETAPNSEPARTSSKPTEPAPVPSGFVVAHVADRGPADRAGIQPGDHILRIGDENGPRTLEQLARWLAEHKPGDDVQFQIRRTGQPAEVRVTLDTQPADGPIQWKSLSSRVLGIWHQDGTGRWHFQPSSDSGNPSGAARPQPMAMTPSLGQILTQVFVGPNGVTSYRFLKRTEGGQIEVEQTGGGRLTVRRQQSTEQGPALLTTRTFENIQELRGLDPEAADIVDSVAVRATVSTPGSDHEAGKTPEDLARLIEHLDRLRATGRGDPRMRDLIATAIRQIEAQQQAAATGRTLEDVLRENEQLRLRIEEMIDQNETSYEFEETADEIIVRIKRGRDSLTRRFPDREAFERQWPRLYQRFLEYEALGQ